MMDTIMLKNELKRLFNQKFTGLLIIILVALYLVLNIAPFFSSEYNLYKNNLKNDHDEIAQYYEIQNNYLLTFKDEVKASLVNKNQQLESSLFQDKKSQLLLKTEIMRLETILEEDSSTKNVYITNNVLNHEYTGIILLVGVSIFIYLIFYQDIQSGILPLYQSTKKALVKLYFTKIMVLLIAALSLILPLLIISQLLIFQTSGPNVQVQTIIDYMNYPYIINVMMANIIAFLQITINVVVFSSILLLILMISRNYIFSIVVVGIIYVLEYLAFSLISINSPFRLLKNLNLYNILTHFKLSNDLIFLNFGVIYSGTLVKVSLIFIAALCFIVSGYLYRKNSDQNYKLNFISINTKSQSLYIHEFKQILIEKKGLLAIIILCSISLFRYNSFSIVQSDWDREFMLVQKTYYGQVTEEKVSQLKGNINEKRLIQDKYDICLTGMEECSKSTLDNYAEEIEDLSYLEIILEDFEAIDLSGDTYYLQRKPFEILYGASSNFTSFINYISLMSIVTYISFISLKENVSHEFDSIIKSTKRGKFKSRSIRRNIIVIISIFLLLFVELFNVLKVHKFYDSTTSLHNLSILLNGSFNLDISLTLYQILNIFIKFLWILTLINLIYVSDHIKKKRKNIMAFSLAFVISIRFVFTSITPEILDKPILLTAIVTILTTFNLIIYRQGYHHAKLST